MTELLQDIVFTRAQDAPLSTAIVDGRQRISYYRLEQASSRLARALREFGCRRGDRVCVAVPTSMDGIVAILGALKADCIYVPLDTASSVASVARLVQKADPQIVITVAKYARFVEHVLTAAEARGLPVGIVDRRPPVAGLSVAFSADDWRQHSADPVTSANEPDDPACMLFTCGLVDVPRGVVVTHANISQYVNWARTYFHVGPAERLSGFNPLHYDQSAHDIFTSLAAGAELHQITHDGNPAPVRLAEFMRSSAVTQWFSPPETLERMAQADAVEQDDFPALRELLWRGELMDTKTLQYWMERLPHVRFTNLYGPPEATIASSYYTLSECPPEDPAYIPIGVARDGEDLLVLDDEYRPVPTGTVGQLFIGGTGLSRGYWRDPERTAQAFIQRPGGGTADRLYRTDDFAQVGTDRLVYCLAPEAPRPAA